MNFLRKHRISILVALVVVLAVTAGYFYKKSTTTQASITAKEVKNLTSALDKLMILPESETPTVATVSDPEALSDQPFFVGAQKDDKVLIYSNAKRAILYRPSVDKIINIAPLNLGESAPSVTTPTTNTPVKE